MKSPALKGRSLGVAGGFVVSVAVLTVLYVFATALAPTSVATTKAHAAATATCFQTAGFPNGSAVVGMAVTPDDGGYWIVANDGYVAACGDAAYLGQQTTLNAPIVGIAATLDGGGYYLVASDGGIFAFGDAQFQGSTGSIKLNKPVVGMTVDPATGGYRLVASDGGIFSYHAPFLGSTGSMTLNKPVVGMAVAGNGNGYWLVAADGGIFSYGAPFRGSAGSMHLNKPVVGMAADAASVGYWLVASDGGIFSYDAPFYGSTGSITLNKPIVGMEANAPANGYRFVAADGGVFSYGSSKFYGTPTFGSTPAPAPAPASSANCTNPSFSTSDASGTDNTDPNGGEFWWVNNDAWSGSHGPQTIYVCNQSSWYATSNQPDVQGQVETYPDTEYDIGGRDNGLPTTPISGYPAGSITSSFSEAYPSAGGWDAAYDLWTDNWENETMVWNQWSGSNAFWPGQATTPLTIDGVGYTFLANGTNCSAANESTCEYMFFRDAQVTSGSVDLAAIFQWEVAHGYAKASDVPTQLQYGVEISSTSGSETFPMTGLTFSVT
jgi:hypothetical protein